MNNREERIKKKSEKHTSVTTPVSTLVRGMLNSAGLDSTSGPTNVRTYALPAAVAAALPTVTYKLTERSSTPVHNP